jgi:phosphatidate cytidylyltransferase
MSKTYKNEDEKELKKESVQNKEVHTEAASGTCFSSDAETKFKKKEGKLTKIRTALTSAFMPPASTRVEPPPGASKWTDLKTRTIWTVFMLLAFIGIIALGNFYCALLVFLVIMAIYAELLDISRYKERNNEVKNYYLISYYFFAVCTYYFYIKNLGDKLTYLTVYPVFAYMLRYHNLICFMLYIVGFFIFINSLTKGYYRYQFRSFAWIHIILFIFGMSSALIVDNIFNGLVW